MFVVYAATLFEDDDYTIRIFGPFQTREAAEEWSILFIDQVEKDGFTVDDILALPLEQEI